ncbi:MAG: hypothetical protein ACLPN6_18900 [Streptosporangiaceae bacterium]
MSIAAANLFTRSIYHEFVNPDATPARETRVARLAWLIIKVGAPRPEPPRGWVSR